MLLKIIGFFWEQVKASLFVQTLSLLLLILLFNLYLYLFLKNWICGPIMLIWHVNFDYIVEV